MGLYSGGLITGMIFASEIWGAYVWEGFFFWWGGGAYYRNFTVCSLTKVTTESGLHAAWRSAESLCSAHAVRWRRYTFVHMDFGHLAGVSFLFFCFWSHYVFSQFSPFGVFFTFNSVRQVSQ